MSLLSPCWKLLDNTSKRESVMSQAYDSLDFKPPKAAASNAARGLELRRLQKGDKAGLTNEEASDLGIGSGVQRAVNIKNRDNLSPEVVRQVWRFFQRFRGHISKARRLKTREEQLKSKMYVSDLLWGGEAMEDWVERKVAQMDKIDAQRDKVGSLLARRASMLSKGTPLPRPLYNLYPYMDTDSLRAVSEAILQGCQDLPIGTHPDQGLEILYTFDDLRHVRQAIPLCVYYDPAMPTGEGYFPVMSLKRFAGGQKGLLVRLPHAPTQEHLPVIYEYLCHEMAHALDPHLESPPRPQEDLSEEDNLRLYVNHPSEQVAFLAQIQAELERFDTFSECPTYQEISPFLEDSCRRALLKSLLGS